MKKLTPSMLRALELVALADRNNDVAWVGGKTEMHYPPGGRKPWPIIASGTASALHERGLIDGKRDAAGLLMNVVLTTEGRRAVDKLELWPEELPEIEETP